MPQPGLELRTICLQGKCSNHCATAPLCFCPSPPPPQKKKICMKHFAPSGNKFWNKRPKEPHIVHLSAMCHLFDGLARAAILFFRSARKHKLGRGHWDLAYCQVLLNSVQRFQRSRKCLSESEARGASCFSNRPEKHKLGRRRWDLASCQVSLSNVQRFQRRTRQGLSQSEARAVILFFRSVRKTQIW